MRIFVSWSGARSHSIARAVCEWLRMVLPDAKPWLSSEMQKGVTWSSTLLDGLAGSDVGILCVTSEAEHDWMAFEAGALLAGTGPGTLFALHVDSDAVALAASPIGQLAAFAADVQGITALARGLGLADSATSKSIELLLGEINAVGTAHVRNFELSFILPEGSARKPFAPLRDMEWLAALNAIAATLRRDGIAIGEHDFTRFHHLDVRKPAWIATPKRISSVVTDQLAVVHPEYFESWYGNATLAAEMLKSSFQFQDLEQARDLREHFSPGSAFLYGFYLLQLANPALRQPQIAQLLASIQELELLPRSWKLEAPALFIANQDMNALEKKLGQAPLPICQLVKLGFSYASLMNCIAHIHDRGLLETLRQIIRQFSEQLHEIDPPEEVGTPIYDALEVMSQQEDKLLLTASWTSLSQVTPAFIAWLRQPNVLGARQLDRKREPPAG